MLPTNRARRWGYYDLGPTQIPPLPQYLVLTDRGSGVQYLLSWTPEGLVDMTTSLPTTPDVTVFGPYDGPYLSDGIVRLFVSGGVLFAEITDGTARIFNPEPFARRVSDSSYMGRLVIPADLNDPITTVVLVPTGDVKT